MFVPYERHLRIKLPFTGSSASAPFFAGLPAGRKDAPHCGNTTQVAYSLNVYIDRLNTLNSLIFKQKAGRKVRRHLLELDLHRKT